MEYNLKTISDFKIEVKYIFECTNTGELRNDFYLDWKYKDSLPGDTVYALTSGGVEYQILYQDDTIFDSMIDDITCIDELDRLIAEGIEEIYSKAK